MGHCLFERRHVARGVDHASLRAGGAWVVIDCSHLHTAWVRAVWIRVLRGLNCIGAPVESPMLSTGIAAVAHLATGRRQLYQRQRTRSGVTYADEQ